MNHFYNVKWESISELPNTSIFSWIINDDLINKENFEWHTPCSALRLNPGSLIRGHSSQRLRTICDMGIEVGWVASKASKWLNYLLATRNFLCGLKIIFLWQNSLFSKISYSEPRLYYRWKYVNKFYIIINHLFVICTCKNKEYNLSIYTFNYSKTH